MNKLTKTAAVALAVLTIVAGSLGSANAFPSKKGLVGLGIAATVIGAVVAAANAPRCQDVEQFDRRGNYRGTVRVCE